MTDILSLLGLAPEIWSPYTVPVPPLMPELYITPNIKLEQLYTEPTKTETKAKKETETKKKKDTSTLEAMLTALGAGLSLLGETKSKKDSTFIYPHGSISSYEGLANIPFMSKGYEPQLAKLIASIGR